ENAASACRLRHSVCFRVAPLTHGLFVPPEGEREELARLAHALEALDRDEAVDLGQQRAQIGRDVEIAATLAILGPEFEDDGDHDVPPPDDSALLSTTGRRKVRSSLRMKPSASA